jgi:predicted nucleic acid-binding protein
LIDSSAFFALASPREANHATAGQIAEWLRAQRWRLFTTNFVRAEAHALILDRAGHSAADRFLVDLSNLTPDRLIRVTEADEERALAIIERYRDKDFSLTDATSFAVMERIGISYAFSFDRDFAQYGFAVLTPEILA